MLLHSFLIELNKIKAKAKSVRRTDVIKSNCLFVVVVVVVVIVQIQFKLKVLQKVEIVVKFAY